MTRLGLALLVTLLCACRRAPEHRLVVLNTAGKPVVEVVSVGTVGAPKRKALPGLLTAEPYGDASNLIAIREDGARHRLVRVNVANDTREDGPEIEPLDTIVGVSDDGRRVLLRSLANTAARIVDFSSGKRVEHVLRYLSSGTLSPDGSEALVSGTPTSCTGTFDACPMPLVRLRFDGGTADVVRPGPGATYHARYLPDGRVVFQTTTLAGCPTINACRHDIVSVPRGDLGAAPSVLRQDGYSPSFSRDAKSFSFLVYDDPDTHCTKMPCETANLYVSNAGNVRKVVSAEVSMLPPNALSADGAWVGYRTREKEMRVCPTNGGTCLSLGEGWVRGWL